MRPLLCLLWLLLLLPPPRPARAHGGLPLSTEIIWRGATLYVPTQYWGIFVGTDGGPWRWICDEAINNYKLREVYLGGDDTFYATDLTGITISRDGGCTWAPAAGELERRDVLSLLPDPARPARVWVVTIEDGRPALWRSEDSGRSFTQRYLAPGQAQRGIALSPDGQRVYLTALRVGAGMDPEPTLHVSSDGGERFTAYPITPRPPFLRTVPVAVDGRDARVVYLVNQGDPTQVLLRVDGDSGRATELLRLERPIFGAVTDVAQGRLFVPTGDGLYYQDGNDGQIGSQIPVRSEGLSRAQCVSPRDGRLYACSWNYFPDEAAVARSDDGGQRFRRVFQYAETQGVLACPEGSNVARICPGVWATSASLLGIDTGADMGPAADLGDDGPQPGCACTVGRPAAPGGWAPGLLLALLFGLGWREGRRERARRPGAGG